MGWDMHQKLNELGHQFGILAAGKTMMMWQQ
jgi:hypothetical protein